MTKLDENDLPGNTRSMRISPRGRIHAVDSPPGGNAPALCHWRPPYTAALGWRFAEPGSVDCRYCLRIIAKHKEVYG